MTMLPMSIETALGGPITPTRLLRLMRDMIRYGAASLVALSLDYSTLLILNGSGIGYHLATAGGFLIGLTTIYLLSVRYVFEGRRSRAAHVEMVGFLVTGLCGLLLSEALMSLFVSGLGLPVAIAKAPTSGVNFLFNFLSRRALLFKELPADSFDP